MDTSPRITDTRHAILARIVAALAASKSAPLLAPVATDTRWQLLRKWNQLRAL